MRLQLTVFALVASSFTNIYLTQPVLPVLQEEFGVGLGGVSLSVSAVILGIALSILPFGIFADRHGIRPIILTGGVMVTLAGVVCALSGSFVVLVGGRFVQGLFIPALTSCLAAHLAKALPKERLNVVMGSYVAATVVGGMGGRLLGGWIHPPLHWRYAFVSAALLLLAATLVALWSLPRTDEALKPKPSSVRFLDLLQRWELVRLFLAASGGFFVFSSLFNFLPFRLSSPPFSFATETITLFYLVYVMGIFMGPLAGKISNRVGGGMTLVGGTAVLVLSLTVTLLPWSWSIVLGMVGVCGGFFTIHAAAVGSLNRRLAHGQGRANALYVLFYYVGGWVGITLSGLAYSAWAWPGVVGLCAAMAIFPLIAGIGEGREPTPTKIS